MELKDNKKLDAIKSSFYRLRYQKDFKNIPYKMFDIFFFLSFFIFIPILWVIIRSIILPNWYDLFIEYFIDGIKTNEHIIVPFYFCDLIIFKIFAPTIGVIWLFKKDPIYFLKNKFWILPFFYPTRLIISQIFNNTQLDSNSITLISSVILPLIIIILYCWKNKELLDQFKINFKDKNYIPFIKFGIISAIVFIILLLCAGMFTLAIGGGVSDNESSLQGLLSSPYSIVNLFFSAVIVAPLLEEFVFRQAISNVTGNKWYAWPITTIFFAFVHISNTGDWINIMSYIPLGFVAGFLYYKLNNLTYPILFHFGNNFIVFISYFI